MRCGHRFRGSTQVIALVSSASSCIGVHLSSDPAAAIQASSDLAAASNEGIDLVESDEIGDAWRQESEQGRGQSKGSPCSTLLARGVIGAVLSVPRRASVERDGTVASIFELYSLHGVSSRTNGGFLSFVASVLGLVGGCCFLQLLVRYLFCQMTASAKTSNNRAEEACESVSPAGSASAPDMDGETFGISAVHASLASLREQLGIMLRTDAAEQNDGVVAGETYCTSRIASRADSDAEARHRRDAELLKRTHASLALKCFPTARVMSAQASLDLVFDACFEEMDHVRFSEELLAALRAVGMTDAAVDQLIVELRSGSVIATISGPASVIQDLRKKPLQTLKVMGYSPILFCRGQGGASGEGGMDQSTAALIVQRAYRRWCVSQRHCHAVVLPGMGRTWVLAYRHFRVQQSHWRGQRGRAALMIQAAYRCHSVRLAVRRRVDMRQALRIQRTWRGRRVRQRLRFSACDRIRARKARACVRQLMALAVPIQSLWRGRSARRFGVHCHNVAVKIQRRWRCNRSTRNHRRFIMFLKALRMRPRKLREITQRVVELIEDAQRQAYLASVRAKIRAQRICIINATSGDGGSMRRLTSPDSSNPSRNPSALLQRRHESSQVRALREQLAKHKLERAALTVQHVFWKVLVPRRFRMACAVVWPQLSQPQDRRPATRRAATAAPAVSIQSLWRGHRDRLIARPLRDDLRHHQAAAVAAADTEYAAALRIQTTIRRVAARREASTRRLAWLQREVCDRCAVTIQRTFRSYVKRQSF